MLRAAVPPICGQTKVQLPGTDANAIAVDPTNAQNAYAASRAGVLKRSMEGIFGAGTYKSSERGATWSPINDSLNNLAVWAVVVDPNTPNMIYTGTNGGGLFRSNDSGNSRQNANNGIADTVILSIAIEPSNSGTIHVGTKTAGRI